MCSTTRQTSQRASRKLSSLTSRGGKRVEENAAMEGGGKPHPDGQPRIWDYVTLSGKRWDSGKDPPIWLNYPRSWGVPNWITLVPKTWEVSPALARGRYDHRKGSACATVLALEIRGSTAQGRWAASGSWRGRGNGFSPEPPEGIQLCRLLIFVLQHWLTINLCCWSHQVCRDLLQQP